MHASSQTLIAFSCAPGKTALDETQNGRNSIFTGSLLEHIVTPNEHIEDIFRNVARDVHFKSGSFQRPYRSTDLTEKVYLVTNNVSERKWKDFLTGMVQRWAAPVAGSDESW
ncbi:unnamed protein product [Rotaria sp. Silwood1]|nr:unnamed protein product [Rotaria sp. Silwood1]